MQAYSCGHLGGTKVHRCPELQRELKTSLCNLVSPFKIKRGQILLAYTFNPSAPEGDRRSATLKPAWSIQRLSGQPGLQSYCENLSLNK